MLSVGILDIMLMVIINYHEGACLIMVKGIQSDNKKVLEKINNTL